MSTAPTPTSVSCLRALPLRDLELLGLKDLDDPVVVLDFRLEQGQLTVFEASTVSRDGIAGWLEQMPRDQRLIFEGCRLHLQANNEGDKILSGCGPHEEKMMFPAVEPLFEQMRQERGLMLEAVAQLPSFDDLHGRIEAVAEARLQRAIDSGKIETLPLAQWTIMLCCAEHHGQSAVEELVDMAQVLEQDSLANRLVSCLGGGQLNFMVPTVSPSPCADQSAQHQVINFLLGRAAFAMLDEIVPRLYAEYELERATEGVIVLRPKR